MVAPGAFATAWVFAATTTESSIGLILGWIPGVLAALFMGGAAYVGVNAAPRSLRTIVGLCLAAMANVLYVVLVWQLMKSLG